MLCLWSQVLGISKTKSETSKVNIVISYVRYIDGNVDEDDGVKDDDGHVQIHNGGQVVKAVRERG